MEGFSQQKELGVGGQVHTDGVAALPGRLHKALDGLVDLPGVAVVCLQMEGFPPVFRIAGTAALPGGRAIFDVVFDVLGFVAGNDEYMVVGVFAAQQIEAEAVPLRFEDLDLINENTVEAFRDPAVGQSGVHRFKQRLEVSDGAGLRAVLGGVGQVAALQQIPAQPVEGETAHVFVGKAGLGNGPLVIVM